MTSDLSHCITFSRYLRFLMTLFHHFVYFMTLLFHFEEKKVKFTRCITQSRCCWRYSTVFTVLNNSGYVTYAHHIVSYCNTSCQLLITLLYCLYYSFRLTVKRNKVKYAQFIRKRMNTNPKRGPFHFRSPARMFWRTVSTLIRSALTRCYFFKL